MSDHERTVTTPQGNDSPAADALGEIDRLREELRREHEMHLRALADFDNFRRRVERDRSATAQSGKRDVILSLLDLADNFDRALLGMPDAPPAWREGVQAIHRKLVGLLQGYGVATFPSVGETFDPEVHEAIGSADSDEHRSGTVIDELQRGYRWGNELLRPARVRVAR